MSSLSSFLREQFYSYMKEHPDDIKQCLDITSIWKKPSYYHFTTHYNEKTNQIIWEGFVAPRDEEDYNEFTMIDDANSITVGNLLCMMHITDDYADIVGEGQKELFEKLVIDVDETIHINN